MLLSREEFINYAEAVSRLPGGGIGLDLETTGLSVYQGKKAFLIGVAHESLGRVAVFLDEGSDWVAPLQLLCSNRNLRYAGHHLAFELGFLRTQFRTEILGRLWCTETMERVLYNNYWKKGAYSLEQCAQRRGFSKYQPMADWLDHWKGDRGDAFVAAPKEIIVPYVEEDAWLSLFLMNDQIKTFKQWDQSPVKISPVVSLEMLTTPALFNMQSGGIRVNIPYCKEALEFERSRAREAALEFQRLTGSDFVDSRKCLAPIFDRLGLRYGRTEAGNDSFGYDALAGIRSHEVVRTILRHRDAVKRASSYWENLLLYVCPDGRIHPSIHQAAAKTSRMSIRDPACQTWPDDSEPDKDTGWVSPFPVRRALEAEPGCQLVSLDWKGMELGKMADEAEEMGLIARMQAGEDLHQDVANQAKVPRGLAKNGRFAKLYGAGDKRIARTLGIDLVTAKRISRAIDDECPKIAAYCDSLIHHARQQGWSYNWLGRRYFFDRGHEYKAPNYRIQGGCGEILRLGIIYLAAFLEKNARPATRILLPIHDQLVVNCHQEDLHLISGMKQVMASAQTDRKFLSLDLSVEVGPNLHDLEGWKDAQA